MSEETTHPAGEGVSDDEFAAQVAGQTSSDLKAEDLFAREHDGASTHGEVADVDADDLSDR
jgi:hypothetical protein